MHGDDFIVTGDSVQLMWIESRLKEGLNVERCADLGVDDGVDKTVTILSQLVTWSNQTGILLARMSMDGFDICVVLCCGCEVRIGTSRNSIAQTNQEFERHANVEILLEWKVRCVHECWIPCGTGTTVDTEIAATWWQIPKRLFV